MFSRNKLFSGIVAASSVLASGVAGAAIEEVVVTATKRAESTQDIPVAVSAVTEQALEQLGISNFEDYLLQLPGVTAGGSGPGQNTIYIRGVASTTPNLTTAGVAGLAPNVALYLDEQPLSQPGRNLDVYAADLNRVEVLSGPQGTLFGASSQAGTVRLITNKPDHSGSYGKVKASFGSTAYGDDSNSGEVMFNLAATDSVAIRGVIYRDQKGGYIDNVHGTRTTEESARFRAAGTVRDNGVAVSERRGGFQAGADLSGVTFLEADNSELVADDINETVYEGGRLAVAADLNDNFELLVSAATQDVDADGVFFADPNLGDLETQQYEQSRIEDSFDNLSWTLTGRFNELEMVYTGAYTERDTDQRVDYSDYLFVGQYLPYYICDSSVTYPGDSAPSGTCQAPNLFVNSQTSTEVQTHEFRLSGEFSSATRFTVGAFYSELELQERNDFTYPGSAVIGFAPNFPLPDSWNSDAGPFPEGVIFRNDVRRIDEQSGLFGELTFELSDQWAVIAGARRYDIEVDFDGSANSSFYNMGAEEDAQVFGTNITQLNGGRPAEASGSIFKLTANWTPNSDSLFYATLSEGFRPGLINRPGGAVADLPGGGTYTVPVELDTDDVMNYELGWKTDLAGGQLRFNGSLFLVEIEKLQTTIFDPSITNLFFSDNAADAEVTGLEADFIYAPDALQGLTVSGAFSLLDSEITKVLTPTDDVRQGDELAFAPELQANLQARYEWSVEGGAIAHVMSHIAHSAESYSDIIAINRDRIDSWTLFGVTAGVTTEQWSAELYIDNLTDERAELARNFVNDVQRVSYARPRTWGMRLSYSF
ncbi:TonB-dependent receptor [Gammaproteobacteria bacterium LSUCC0057]|uniref:TonB-dependent receptor n=1 Tax=Gammaproteobacteria bacterium LSUCC0057 TaxID=2559237 RepID=A0A4Y8UII9_9GAMM|nr:TonB-dependent receptor [Gammaproteobacteria bacterium LSUCC0057]